MSNDAGLARAARPEDLDPLLQTLCAAFGIDIDAARPLFFRDPFFDLSHKRILLTQNAGLVSCLTVIPASLRIGGADVPTGGIAGVATQPKYQHSGYAGRLLSATIPALADELHYPVSALFPYCPEFYRRYGWETASRVAYWAAATASLPLSTEAAFVRPVQGDQDRAALHRLHKEASRSRTGAFERDTRRWTVIETLNPSREAVVYQGRSGSINGYLLYERCPRENGGTLAVHEMYGVTQAARQGLLGFLVSQAKQYPQITWAAAVEDLQTFGLEPPKEHFAPLQISDQPSMMLRLIDLKRALACLHTSLYAPILNESKSTLTIRATDTEFPRNEIPVRLSNSGIEAGELSDPAWIAADIRVFAQVYIGYRTPSDAAVEGLLTASSAETLALADRLFPARNPYVSPADQF